MTAIERLEQYRRTGDRKLRAALEAEFSFVPSVEGMQPARQAVWDGVAPPPRVYLVLMLDGNLLDGWGYLARKGNGLYTILNNSRWTELDPAEFGRTWIAYQ